jgi:pSer/pThr/pTyr-binding forkhead associated (FHA) protein
MSAAMKLEVFQDGQLLQEIPFDNSEVWVGRDQGCVIRLEDRAISRRHALLKSTDRGIEFEKKSKFGWVKVNGLETTQTTLKTGDRLEMGPYEIRVSGTHAPAGASAAAEPIPVEVSQVVDAPIQLGSEPIPGVEPLPPLAEPSLHVNEPPVQNTGAVEITPEPEVAAIGLEIPDGMPQHTQSIDMASMSNEGATKVFSAQNRVKAVLKFNDGEANVSQYELSDEEIAIGRSQQCHVVLEDKKSSRKHAIIRREGEKYYLKDLGSGNGTQLNGSRIDDVELQSGDKIQIGETTFTFELIQADYEEKKADFIAVPQQEVPPANAMMLGTPAMQSDMQMPPMGMPSPAEGEQGQQDAFSAPQAEKKSLIGKALDRYRAMNTKQQIIYGALVLVTLWFLLEDEPVEQHARLNNGTTKAQVKKGETKPGGVTFDALTPEQQRYIETQYQLAFDLYKNREYDKALLEVGKIFSLVQDYKNAREIEAFAREGKRKLEAQEEERKRKEAERQNQLKLQTLLEQAGMLMDKKRFREAEALFPEIELIQPENAAVNEWRKQIMAEGERMELERQERERLAEILRQGWIKYQAVVEYRKDRDFQTALDGLEEIRQMEITDRKLKQTVREEESKIRGMIAAARDPLLAQAKELEQGGQMAAAFKAFEKAHQIDPEDTISQAGMARIHGSLTARAKALYIEGVFAESYNDLDGAERSFREILNVVPKGDEYHAKAELRLKRLTAFRKPAAEAAAQ